MRTVITLEYFFRRRASASLLALSIAVCLMLISVSSRAESAELSCREKPKAEKQTATLAGDLFARGERAFTERQYVKALKRFLCSLYTFEHEATLTNVKEIADFVEPPEQAVALLDEYITLNPEGRLTPQVAEIAAAVKTKTNVGQPAQVEETEPVPEPTTVEAPPIPNCILVPDPTPYLRHAGDENQLFKLLGAATLGTGAALVIAGAVLQGLSIGAGNDGDLQRQKQFQTGAIVGFAGGAVTAGIGTLQLVLALKKQKQLQQLKSAPAVVEQCDSSKAFDKPKVEATLDAGFGSAGFSVRF